MLLYACLLALAGVACGDPVTVKSSWNGGFEGEFSIQVTQALNGWTLELTFSSAPAALEVGAARRGAVRGSSDCKACARARAAHCSTACSQRNANLVAGDSFLSNVMLGTIKNNPEGTFVIVVKPLSLGRPAVR